MDAVNLDSNKIDTITQKVTSDLTIMASPPQKARPAIGVGIALMRNDRILLLLRNAACWEGSKYSIVGGGLDENETLRQAVIREAWEEVGVELHQKQVQLAHVTHERFAQQDYIHFYFIATTWHGEPYNKESHKHDTLGWFSLHELPSNLAFAEGIYALCHRSTSIYSERGWNRSL